MSLDGVVFVFGAFVSFLAVAGIFLSFNAPAYREEYRPGRGGREDRGGRAGGPMRTTRACALVAALLFVPGPAHAAPQRADGLPDLSAHRWRSRVIVLSAPSASDAERARALRLLADRAGEAEERDVVVVEVLSPGPFAVHLVGKDGGVKLRREGRVDLDELWAVIDAMPMRREEKRRRGRE